MAQAWPAVSVAQQGWPEAVHLGKHAARVLSPPQLAAGDDDRVVPVSEGTTGPETGAMIQLFPMAGRIECISVLLFKENLTQSIGMNVHLATFSIVCHSLIRNQT